MSVRIVRRVVLVATALLCLGAQPSAALAQASTWDPQRLPLRAGQWIRVTVDGAAEDVRLVGLSAAGLQVERGTAMTPDLLAATRISQIAWGDSVFNGTLIGAVIGAVSLGLTGPGARFTIRF